MGSLYFKPTALVLVMHVIDIVLVELVRPCTNRLGEILFVTEILVLQKVFLVPKR